MKKVRYATGALAALGTMPALALVTPPAAAAVTQAPARTGKTVSLTAAATAAPCDARSASSLGGTFSALIKYSRGNGCIGLVSGILEHHTNSGWWMRVRSYANGNLSHNRFNKNGIIHVASSISDVGGHNIKFKSFPFNTHISMVCEAMVRSTSPTVVQFGPKCEGTGF
jgi:hypothetical protein